MSYRSPLSRARGLGSAKEGLAHWWLQRITALALVPLTIWLVLNLALLGQYDYESVLAWLRNPVSAVLLICMVIALFYHSALGVQVVAEDYISTKWRRLLVIISVNFASFVLAVVSILAIVKIVLGSGGEAAL